MSSPERDYIVIVEGSQDTLVIEEPAITILQASAPETVILRSVGEPGPPGPQGAQGEQGPQGDGEGLRLREFSFASPISSWVATHNLGTKTITVVCFENDGVTTKEGLVTYPSFDTVQVDWYFAESGLLRLFY